MLRFSTRCYKGSRASEASRVDLRIVNPRKLEHRFRMIHAGIPFTLL